MKGARARALLLEAMAQRRQPAESLLTPGVGAVVLGSGRPRALRAARRLLARARKKAIR